VKAHKKYDFMKKIKMIFNNGAYQEGI